MIGMVRGTARALSTPRGTARVALALTLAVVGTARAQDAPTTGPGPEPSSSLIESIALYPEDTRDVVLQASTMPGVLEGLAEIQRGSSADFRALLADLPREQQGKIWELSRYPGLVGELVDGGPKSEDELRRLVAGRPEPVRETAVQYGRSRYALLERIRALETQVDGSVAKLLAPYPLPAQAAIQALIAQPDVLSELVEHPELTRELGAIYTADPEGTRQRLRRYAEGAARRNAKALEDWERELAANPEALAELTESAQEYAEEEGLDTTEPPPDEEGESESRVTVYYAYPYWYGYPYWYTYAYWYPQPYYLHWGFYFGSGGQVVVLSTGSYRFLSWHYGHPHNHYRYSHLHALYYDHARRHQRYHGGGSEAVRDWAQRNRDRLPRDWARSDGKLASRFADYGRFEEGYAKANRERPQSREEFRRAKYGRDASPRKEGVSQGRDPGSERATQRDPSRRRKETTDRSRESRQREPRSTTRGRSDRSQRHEQAWENHSRSWKSSGGRTGKGSARQKAGGGGSRSSGGKRQGKSRK